MYVGTFFRQAEFLRKANNTLLFRSFWPVDIGIVFRKSDIFKELYLSSIMNLLPFFLTHTIIIYTVFQQQTAHLNSVNLSVDSCAMSQILDLKKLSKLINELTD